MSYIIEYHDKKRKKWRVHRIYTLLIFLLSILALINCIYCLNGGFSNLRERIMPWTQLNVQNAWENLEEGIVQGHSFGECIEAFCEEVFSDDNQ